MKIKISSLSSPDRRSRQFLRAPVLYFTAGELLCFHATVEEPLHDRRSLFIELLSVLGLYLSSVSVQPAPPVSLFSAE
jgi:hypothetical protein